MHDGRHGARRVMASLLKLRRYLPSAIACALRDSGPPGLTRAVQQCWTPLGNACTSPLRDQLFTTHRHFATSSTQSIHLEPLVEAVRPAHIMLPGTARGVAQRLVSVWLRFACMETVSRIFLL